MKAVFALFLFPCILLPSLINAAGRPKKAAEIQIAESRAIIEAPNWQTDGDILWTDNCNFDGQDLNVTINIKKEDCRKMCLNYALCNHFTWFIGNNDLPNNCILKKGSWPGNKPSDLADAQCGYIPDRSWQIDGNKVFWKDNCSFEGQDIQGITNPIPNTNQEDCRKLCLNTPLCNHFTWFIGDSANKNVCRLKKGSWSGNKPTALTNAQCGRIPDRSWTADGWTVDGDMTWKINCNFEGQNLNTTIKINKEDCRKMCLNTPLCNHFTWFTGNNDKPNNCILKKGSWPGNTPGPLANAQCGRIPGRSWTTDGWTVDGNVFWKMNCDFGGQEFLVLPNINQEDCGKICYDDPKCDHFTWYIGSCLLRKGNWPENKPTNLADARCGYIPGRSWQTDVNVDANVLWDGNCDFRGQTSQQIANTPHTTQAICRKWCLNTPTCDHFTWYIGWSNYPNVCYLKQGSWPGNQPDFVLPDGQCGFISGRSWTADGWTVDANFYWKDNCDFQGQVSQQLGSTPGITRDDCRKKCFTTPLCTHFTWYIGWSNYPNVCYLKKGSWPGNRPDSTLPNGQCGFISGRSFTADGWTVDTDLYWKDDCDFIGNDIFGNNLVTNIKRNDCGKLCKDHPICSLFTWSPEGNTCLLKAGRMKEATPPVASPLATARCGYIPSRLWEVKDNVVYGTNCGFAGRAWTYNRDSMYNRITTSKEECSRECAKLNSGHFVCTHFTFENGNCYLRNWKVEYLRGALYVPNAQCGYFKN